MFSQTVCRTISAQNQFTQAVPLRGRGIATLVATGTFTATMRIQIRALTDVDGAAWADASTGWNDITDASLTAVGQKTTLELGGEWEVRAGCKTGEFTSATGAKVFLGVSYQD